MKNDKQTVSLQKKYHLPPVHAVFLEKAIPVWQKDVRISAVAAGGSFITREMDEFSDLDLIIAVTPESFPDVMKERQQIAGKAGKLLASFTGEHVGEPRLLICLYGPPLLHVDLKFVALPDAADRVEDPVILWERDLFLTRMLEQSKPRYPAPDLQWIEDRLWVWVHYVAGKIGRGELLEAYDNLSFLRINVLGPMALMASGAHTSGVRKIETHAREYLPDFLNTLADYHPLSCARALRAAAKLYRVLRNKLGDKTLVLHAKVEKAAMLYLDEIENRVSVNS
jgi:predicted nucleotidyltransferase